jgi:hypothetical protein
VPNPTLVVSLLVGTSRNFNPSTIPGLGIDGTKVGLPAETVRQFDLIGFPRFTLDGYATVGNPRRTQAVTNNHNIQLNVTKEHGVHSVKFGFSAEAGQLNFLDASSATFGFNRGMTSGPTAASNSSTTGNSIASLLLGTGGAAARRLQPTTHPTRCIMPGTRRIHGGSTAA